MSMLPLRPGQPFDLDATLACGQVFRWDRRDGGWWCGVAGDRVIRIRQDGRRLEYTGAPAPFIRRYFALDLDLENILESIDRDPFIHACISRNRGLRIIRQPPWECTLSYICATNSNIPTIRRRIAAIAQKYGKAVECEDETYYTFPGPDAVAAGGHGALAECRLGYRQPYVLGTSCSVSDVQCWEEELRRLPYEGARGELVKLHGIGKKAADCILLFAFQKYEAFPVDVWIRRIMQEHYLPDICLDSPLSNREYDTIRRFARGHFGEYCGWAQEYLYAAREG